MTLVDIELALFDDELPKEVLAFLHEADSCGDWMIRNNPYPLSGFVPSDFVTVYRALRAISESNLVAGNTFCEWGSGLGVVASLAAMLEFDSCGIEIEQLLVDLSRKLAAEFGLPVDFVQGSFVPADAQALAETVYAEQSGEFSWLVTETDGAYDELGLDPDDFDLVYAYPWPNEEYVIEALFDSCAAEGALLLTYLQYDCVRLQRKVRKS